MSSLERATFGRKHIFFWKISVPSVEKLGDPWTPVTKRRKLLLWFGNDTIIMSSVGMTTIEFIVRAHL